MVVDIPLVALQDAGSSSGIPGLAGADVLLRGAGSSLGLGNCLIHTDKNWQIISPFFYFTKVSLETLHQLRVFRVFASHSLVTGRLNLFHWPL